MRVDNFMKAYFRHRSGTFFGIFPSIHADIHWGVESAGNCTPLIFDVFRNRLETENIQRRFGAHWPIHLPIQWVRGTVSQYVTCT